MRMQLLAIRLATLLVGFAGSVLAATQPGSSSSAGEPDDQLTGGPTQTGRLRRPPPAIPPPAIPSRPIADETQTKWETKDAVIRSLPENVSLVRIAQRSVGRRQLAWRKLPVSECDLRLPFDPKSARLNQPQSSSHVKLTVGRLHSRLAEALVQAYAALEKHRLAGARLASQTTVRQANYVGCVRPDAELFEQLLGAGDRRACWAEQARRLRAHADSHETRVALATNRRLASMGEVRLASERHQLLVRLSLGCQPPCPHERLVFGLTSFDAGVDLDWAVADTWIALGATQVAATELAVLQMQRRGADGTFDRQPFDLLLVQMSAKPDPNDLLPWTRDDRREWAAAQ